ncbi:MAG: hypothetical protein Q9213_001988 [Squamulea squamosa]
MKRSMTGVENNLKRLSVLSHLNIPHASKKPRNVSEYSIELDDPYRTFAPGDRIKGQVVLNVERPVRITHLTICLHGVVKVLKNGRVPAESTSRWRSYLATGQGKWGEAYFGNGLAALFKDEVILAGDGCLATSLYRFNFDLELPTHGLPSSIDFQHGSISYMLSSTLTRPTTLSPTSRCERMITVKETIDVATLSQPIPRIIPIETVHRKSRRTKTTVISQRPGSCNGIRAQQMQASLPPSSAVSEASDESQQSPSVSDASHVSTISTGQNDPEPASTSLTRRVSVSVDGHSLTSSDGVMLNPTATVKMLQSGCLPGDIISVRVAINLNKHFKNPHGIILTLYRECHIDLHPAIPLGSWQDGKKQQYEDYYPKSRTGLGGLSLSSAGSSRVFRQDINQKTTALYVDRQILSADVKASVQVPEGVFPTISSVPGAMINFRYYLETIIDLRGKSAIQERILPRLSMVNPIPTFGPGESGFNTEEGYDTAKTQFNSGLSFFETSQIRRDKAVVTHVSEIIVGTKNSSRNRSKKAGNSEDRTRPQNEVSGRRNSTTGFDVYDGWHDTGYTNPHADNVDQNVESYPGHSHTNGFVPGHDVAPPETEDQVDEKTRLRRAEELLLPSSPLQASDEQSSWRDSDVREPTAPAPFEEDHLPNFDQPGPSAPAYDRTTTATPQNAVGSTSQSPQGNGGQEESNADPMEDKQELERRRLQAQVSSPDGAAVTDGSVPDFEMHATAPILDEDISNVHDSSQYVAEHLPRYQA